MDAVLWEFRAPVWSSTPPQPPGAQFLIDACTTPRRPLAGFLPPHPLPQWESLVGAIQAARGSALGVDGIPYE
eukprot:11034880-Alexandrium_andersonii.AAC.1